MFRLNDSLQRMILPPILFDQLSVNEKKSEKISEALTNIFITLTSTLTEKNKNNKEKISTILTDVYLANKEILTEFSNNLTVSKQILNNLTKIIKNINSSTPTPGKTTFSLFSMAAATGASTSFNVKPGIPNGGSDMCSGLISCIQGYITNANEEVIAAFNSFLQSVNNGNNLAARWALSDCMTIDKVGATVKDILETMINTTLNPSVCPAENQPFNGYSLQSQVQGFSVNQCQAYQDNYMALSQSCMSDGKVVGYGFAIFAITLAAVLVCGCCIAGSTFCFKKFAR